MSSNTAELFGIVVRGIIALGLLATIPLLFILEVSFPEPLWALVGIPIGYYFRQVKK